VNAWPVLHDLYCSGTAGTQILYDWKGCLCYNSTDCQPENSTLFQLTNNVSQHVHDEHLFS
jgi:hypothetical protein